MQKYGVNELRERFLAFYEARGHLRLPSFSLVPQGDKSLLLINSGMAPMKPWFTGEHTPPSLRVTTCQKCLRTVDIDNVGKTARHCTYFEMLGNFSFGDYFKEEAIAWYWEFLTRDLGFEESRLYPSVYLEDDEAFDIWRDKIGIAPERITKLGKADNFWEHGAGPCGPCSEVYYDRGEEFGCGSPDCAPGCECDRFIEIGNNVFTQFSNDGQGNYTELSRKNIDFGGGLERLAMVCQGANSVYEIDTFISVTEKISEISGVRYGESDKKDASLRIITEHARAGVMLISDGVLPSNEGRGYVLRRLLRRAVRHGRLLGITASFLRDVAETVIATNESAYPEVREREGHIKSVLAAEEESFNRTLDAGTELLSNVFAAAEAAKSTVISGEDAFRLYDTYGFPIDLTIELADERGYSVDTEQFDALMKQQRERARAARLALGDFGWEGFDFGDDKSETEFVGYDSSTAEAIITAIIKDGELVGSLDSVGDEGVIVLDRTPLYAEMGGQVGDHGAIYASTGAPEADFAIDDTQKTKGGKFLHHGTLRGAPLKLGDRVTVSYDAARRDAIRRAHTATHLLHSALRRVLGEHVHQAGSLVEPDRLRFDFTHTEALEAEQLTAAEQYVNAAILGGAPVNAREMPIDDAKKLGAAALFGEKYGDIVRVVTMGEQSIELCGGTHLDNTARAGLFHITAEFSVASGVRRIEAVTGSETLDALHRAKQQLFDIGAALRVGDVGEIPTKIEQQTKELRELRRAAEQAKAQSAGSLAEELLNAAIEIEGLKTTIYSRASTTDTPIIDADELRKIGDALREREPRIVALFISSTTGEKVTFFAACGKEAVASGVKAGDLIKRVAQLAGGSGGGKPESAMGGGKRQELPNIPDNLLSEFIKEVKK
ncbi:MAG: alanine--tRNA ligase [Oscillospiraceae bacterium]|jgi:alanyl-tRNA synthetase|nr:alanine--tRNA ligase [Oscillospiraceae bacterium]